MRQRLIILLFFICFTLSAKAQKRDTIIYFPNGKIAEQGKILHGLRYGIWVGYDEEGEKISEIEYAQDSYNGKYITYFFNGNIQEEGYYISVPIQIDTLSNTFHNSPHDDTLMTHGLSEIRTGIWKEYFENGQLQSEGSYFPRYFETYRGPDTVEKDSDDDVINIHTVINEGSLYLKDGIWKYYNESGKLICEEYWKNLRLIKKNEY